MNWSNEWKNSPGFVEKINKEWQEHVDVNGGINPIALGIRDMGAEAGMPPIDQSIKPVKLSIIIIINPGDFPTPVHAIQVGDLAVHKNLRKEGYWQVTHVPTLTRFNVVHGGLHRKSDLIEWCKTVQAQLADDWKELALLTKDSYKERSSAKDRIMNLCQGTPV